MKPIKTPGGFLLDEVISALQKDIRRGNEEHAMDMARELIPRYEAYLWQRLCVIVNEDIGVANPQLLLIVPQQRALYMEFREAGKDGSARLVLANTILLMARSPKSRLADHFQCVVFQRPLQDNIVFAIPDYAIDKHTLQGKQLKRGVEHWLDVGCVLVNKSDLHDPYEAKARRYWTSPKFVKIAWPPRKKGKGKKGQSLVVDPDTNPNDEPIQPEDLPDDDQPELLLG